jgi:hypothetical protein
MSQFPTLKPHKSFWDTIPTPVLVIGWLAALCLSATCLYMAAFGSNPFPQAPVPTAGAQVDPTQPSGAVTSISGQQPVAQPTQGQQPKPPTATPQPSNRNPNFGYGVQVNGLILPDYTADMATQVRANWIKQQLRWGVYGEKGPNESDIDWTGYDQIINAANARGLKVMLSIVTAPEWSRTGQEGIHGPPNDLNAYANFLGQVAARYKGKIHAIEVWNEQNLSREWTVSPQQLSAARYVEMLRLAYNAIKAQDPNVIVISGALSPTGWDDGVQATDDFKYLQQMIDAGLLDVADCVGAHHNGYNIGPSVSAQTALQHPKAATAQFKGPFTPHTNGLPHHSWFFYDTLQTYAKMVAGRKPLCVTEFGWATSEGYPGAPQGFEFALDNTLQEQADYIVEAFTLMPQWGFVKLAFLWNLDYGNKGKGYLDDVVPYSLLDVNGQKRPAFMALRKALK